MLKKISKKMKATLTAVTVAMGALLYTFQGGTPPPDGDDLAQPPAIVVMADAVEGGDAEERRVAAPARRSTFSRIALWGLRVLVLTPLTLLGRGALALGKAAAAAAGTALSPVAGFFLGKVLGCFGVLTALFALLWRAVNPDGKWRDFFRPRTLLILALTALAVALAQQVAEETLDSWPYLAQGLETFFVALAVALSWFFVFRRTGHFARQLRRAFFCPVGLACFAVLFCGSIWLGFARVRALAEEAGIFWGIACTDVLRLWLVAGAVVLAVGLSMKVRKAGATAHAA